MNIDDDHYDEVPRLNRPNEDRMLLSEYPDCLKLKDGRLKRVKYLNGLPAISKMLIVFGILCFILGCVDMFLLPYLKNPSKKHIDYHLSLANLFGFSLWMSILSLTGGAIGMRCQKSRKMSTLCHFYASVCLVLFTSITFIVIFILTESLGPNALNFQHVRLAWMNLYDASDRSGKIEIGLLMLRIVLTVLSGLLIMICVLVMVLYTRPVLSHNDVVNAHCHCCLLCRGCCVYGREHGDQAGDDGEEQLLGEAASTISDSTTNFSYTNRFMRWLVYQPRPRH